MNNNGTSSQNLICSSYFPNLDVYIRRQIRKGARMPSCSLVFCNCQTVDFLQVITAPFWGEVELIGPLQNSECWVWSSGILEAFPYVLNNIWTVSSCSSRKTSSAALFQNARHCGHHENQNTNLFYTGLLGMQVLFQVSIQNFQAVA